MIEAGIARALTDMLGEVIREGSGRSARVGRPVAGKTGTSNRGRDAWFVGFSPQLCAAVWVGHDDRKPMAKASGGRLALPIWAQFMRQAHDRVAVLPLPRLPHIVSAVQPPTPEIQRDPEAGAGEMNDLLLDPPRRAGQHSNETPALGDEIIDESALDDL